MRALLTGLAALLVLGAAALFAPSLGLTHPWPLLLGLVLVLAGSASSSGSGGVPALRLGMAALGVLVGWLAYAVRMALLAPDLVGTHAAVLVLALVVVSLVAILGGLDALWSGVLGVAAYHGVYEPLLAADPAAFLTTSPPALVSTLLALGVGAAAGLVGRAAAAVLATGPAHADADADLDAMEARP